MGFALLCSAREINTKNNEGNGVTVTVMIMIMNIIIIMIMIIILIIIVAVIMGRSKVWSRINELFSCKRPVNLCICHDLPRI